MNRIVRQAAVAAATFTACAGAIASNATATATAEVLTPIAVTKSVDLVFGNVVPGNGNITLSTKGVRTNTGTAALSVSGTPSAAGQFDITGTGSNTFSIDYTGSTATLSTGGQETMPIDWITEAVSGTGAATGKTDAATDAATGTLSGGAARIYAGGVLSVGATQAAGTYTGSLKVTVAYN